MQQVHSRPIPDKGTAEVLRKLGDAWAAHAGRLDDSERSPWIAMRHNAFVWQLLSGMVGVGGVLWVLIAFLESRQRHKGLLLPQPGELTYFVTIGSLVFGAPALLEQTVHEHVDQALRDYGLLPSGGPSDTPSHPFWKLKGLLLLCHTLRWVNVALHLAFVSAIACGLLLAIGRFVDNRSVPDLRFLVVLLVGLVIVLSTVILRQRR